ncbi:MAG: hypothetical protein Q9194_006851, partial [Teloschistes cf. exilis]
AHGKLLAFALYNLCKYPEYLEPLVDEIKTMQQRHPEGTRQYDELHLMDGFLKETARLNPTVVFLYPFRFSDGRVVPKDNWLVMSSHAIMQHQDYYDNPSDFEGFRFAQKAKAPRGEGDTEGGSKSLFSSPSFDFPFWGSVKRPCPRRFYVSIVAKMVLSHFIMNYDFELANPNGPQSLAWSFALMPHPMMKLLIRKKTHPLTTEKGQQNEPS